MGSGKGKGRIFLICWLLGQQQYAGPGFRCPAFQFHKTIAGGGRKKIFAATGAYRLEKGGTEKGPPARAKQEGLAGDRLSHCQRLLPEI